LTVTYDDLENFEKIELEKQKNMPKTTEKRKDSRAGNSYNTLPSDSGFGFDSHLLSLHDLEDYVVKINFREKKDRPTKKKEEAKKEPVKVDPSQLHPKVIEEIKSLWMAYNTMKEKIQKFEKQFSAGLFFHLYRKQLKRYDWIRRQSCEIISEGDFILVKKNITEKEKDNHPLKRHYFLFSTFLVLVAPEAEVKQKFRETDDYDICTDEDTCDAQW